MPDATQINASSFEQAGASVSDALERAARPGRVPLAMAGTSPADAAVADVAAAMSTKVAAASADLAPRGPKIRAASAAAAAGFRTTDEDNAALLQAVPADLARGGLGSGPGSASPVTGDSAAQPGIQMVSDGWDDPAEPWRIGPDFEEDDLGGWHPPVLPIDPGGAAGGGSGGTAPV